MATNRKLVFINNGFYHVFNRGLDKRPTFTNTWELNRALELMEFYQYKNTNIKFSRYKKLTSDKRLETWTKISKGPKLVEVICFCLMPNHFHLLLRQLEDKGIAIFMSNFINAYTRYFNTKSKRTGNLFEGVFKAVYIEDDEQLIHLSRYIHLNPTTSSLINIKQLEKYPWSSYPNYLCLRNDNIIKKEAVIDFFKLPAKYKDFVVNQAAYAKELHKIKHKILE